MYYFLRDAANGHSTAEQEWRDIDARFPRAMERVFTHIQRVDAAQSTTAGPLRQAQHVPGAPDLYWWDTAGVGVFYHYDGVDLAIVLVGAVENPPFWGNMRNDAQQRV